MFCMYGEAMSIESMISMFHHIGGIYGSMIYISRIDVIFDHQYLWVENPNFCHYQNQSGFIYCFYCLSFNFASGSWLTLTQEFVVCFFSPSPQLNHNHSLAVFEFCDHA
jgi:hypothetical protein